mmetsp:Transcript_37797/g.70524  ORF Transcript_37797/g.70524 Transcript_37797/m.70524 type:complete len:293 (+) Transcript_37797:63-941(+)
MQKDSEDSEDMYDEHQATKFTYDCEQGQWEQQFVRLRLNRVPFGEGGMRLVYRAREVLEDGCEMDAVLKRIKPHCGLDPEMNYHEAMTQMVAECYAQEFNKACSHAGLPYSIAFLPVSVVKMDEYEEPLCLEPYLAGDYVKHSDNAGHTETDDEVAAAFSYFTYILSEKLLVVCDIQGVGTFYTDPQIHTADGVGFGAGNLGADGLRRFLRTHRHNLLCEQLGLPSPDEGLSDEELARKIQDLEREDAAHARDPDALMTLIPGLGMEMSSSIRKHSHYREGLTALTQIFTRS